MSIVMGVVGWDTTTTAGFHASFGTADDDGNMLVQVQLHEGRDLSKPHKNSVAQGHRLLCQISSHIFRIPPKGTRVMVAVPDKMKSVPGAGVIIATLERMPSARIEGGDEAINPNEERAFIDYGPDTDIIISARSITLRSARNDFISVGGSRTSDGIVIQASDGTGAVFKPDLASIFTASGGTGNCCVTLSSTDMKVGVPGSYMSLDDTGFLAFGKKATLMASAVYLGSLPTIANKVLFGTAPGPAVGAALGVFVSPV